MSLMIATGPGGAMDYMNVKCDANGYLIVTGYGANGTYSNNLAATVALAGGGATVIAGITAKKIMVTAFNIVARGGAMAGTSTVLTLQDTNGTPVVVATILKAGLTQDTVITGVVGAYVTLTNYMTPLTSGAGLVLISDGTITGATSFDVSVNYQLV